VRRQDTHAEPCSRPESTSPSHCRGEVRPLMRRGYRLPERRFRFQAPGVLRPAPPCRPRGQGLPPARPCHRQGQDSPPARSCFRHDPPNLHPASFRRVKCRHCRRTDRCHILRRNAHPGHSGSHIVGKASVPSLDDRLSLYRYGTCILPAKSRELGEQCPVAPPGSYWIAHKERRRELSAPSGRLGSLHRRGPKTSNHAVGIAKILQTHQNPAPTSIIPS
jgi:hypothetical protein